MPVVLCTKGWCHWTFQTSKKRRQKQKRHAALHCWQLHTHVPWPYGVNKTRTVLCLERRWSYSVNQDIVILVCPASPLFFAVKRPHGRRCRVSSQSAVCSLYSWKFIFSVSYIMTSSRFYVFPIDYGTYFVIKNIDVTLTSMNEPPKWQGCKPEITRFYMVLSLMVGI
jgi:hypothetical protein